MEETRVSYLNWKLKDVKGQQLESFSLQRLMQNVTEMFIKVSVHLKLQNKIFHFRTFSLFMAGCHFRAQTLSSDPESFFFFYSFSFHHYSTD